MEAGIPIRSVTRFLQLFREINFNGPITLRLMVAATGIPYPTTSRIVQTMLGHGLIERIPGTKSYCVAAMAMSLSHGFQSANRLAAAGRPAIEALTERIGWPLALMTRVGTSMVARASTHHLTTLSFGGCPVGSSIPILHSASGHVYLAYANKQERAGVLAGLQRFEAHSPLLSMFIQGHPLERICSEGHATYERNRFTQTPGKTSSISVPILLDGNLQGALTVVFFSSAMTMDEALRRYREPLEETALTIEETLAASIQADTKSQKPSGPKKARASDRPAIAATIPAVASVRTTNPSTPTGKEPSIQRRTGISLPH